MDIKIRLETSEDYHTIEELTRDTFWTFWGEDLKICDEHLLVHKLRDVEAFVPELDFVAEIDGKLVGHIIYTRSQIESEDGEKHEMLTFGPLSVLPEYQNRGIGRKLMMHSFDKAKEMGFKAVFIYGHPDYYPRVGFKRGADFGLTDFEGNSYDALMVYILYEGALNGIRGKCCIDPVYFELSEEETFEFDKRFPPKKPHVITPLDILTKRLEVNSPEAAKSISKLDFKALDVMKSRSQREIASLPGVDFKALETIRTVMKEHNFPWGESK